MELDHIQEKYILQERINILPKDLLVTESGLFLLKDGEALPLTAIFADASGVFTIVDVRRSNDSITDSCPNGHQIYHFACGGCANWWCSFRCKCNSPWQ